MKTNNDSVVLVRLRSDVRQLAQQAAVANDRSLSAELRRLITATYSAPAEPPR